MGGVTPPNAPDDLPDYAAISLICCRFTCVTLTLNPNIHSEIAKKMKNSVIAKSKPITSHTGANINIKLIV